MAAWEMLSQLHSNAECGVLPSWAVASGSQIDQNANERLVSMKFDICAYNIRAYFYKIKPKI